MSADNERTKGHPGLTAAVRGLVNTVHMASPAWPWSAQTPIRGGATNSQCSKYIIALQMGSLQMGSLQMGLWMFVWSSLHTIGNISLQWCHLSVEQTLQQTLSRIPQNPSLCNSSSNGQLYSSSYHALPSRMLDSSRNRKNHNPSHAHGAEQGKDGTQLNISHTGSLACISLTADGHTDNVRMCSFHLSRKLCPHWHEPKWPFIMR